MNARQLPPIDAVTRQMITERRQRLIEDINKVWPEGDSAEDATYDVRRDLSPALMPPQDRHVSDSD